MRLLFLGMNITSFAIFFRNFLFVILSYLFIFNPPFTFLPVSILKILYLVVLPFFFIKKIRSSFYRQFQRPLLLMGVLIVYGFFIKFLFASDAIFAQANLFMLLESFFMSYVLATLAVKFFKEKTDLWLMYVLVIASLITVFLILFPHLNLIVRSSVLITDDKFGGLLFRGFGIADSLLFTYPVVLGLGACIAVKYAEQKMLYYLFVLLFLIAIFFNARLGIVPIALMYLYILFLKGKFKIVVAQFFLLVLLFVLLLSTDLAREYEDTISWVIDGFTEIINFIQGKENDKLGNTDVLATMLVFPDSFGTWVIGNGKDIFSASDNSDIGYILQLHYGGIIYVLLLLMIQTSFYRELVKRNKSNSWFNIVFIGTLLLCNIKGYFFITNSGTRFLFLLMFVYTLLNKSRCSYKSLKNND